MSFTKVSNLFLPLKPLRGRPIWLLGGIQVRTFSPNIWSLNFSPNTQRSKIFSTLYAMSDMFLYRYVLSCAGYFSPQVFPCTIFLLEISLQDFFSEITHNPLKRQMVGPKITPTFAQYSFFVRIVKAWNSLPNYLFNDEINVSKFKKGLKRWMKIYWHSRSYFNCIYFHFVPALMIFTRLFFIIF